jgi:uncharacterized protein YggE
MDTTSKEKSNLLKAAGMLAIILSIFFVVKVISEIKGLRFIGGGAPAGNTISFEGSGEVFAAPDIAMVNITIREEAKDVKDAQTKATAKEKAALAFLAEQKIEKKDIKTESYNSYPKYDYGRPCYNTGMPCSSETPKIIGYEVSENISVKVRDLSMTGVIMSGLGNLGVGELNGPNLSIENEDELKAKARKMAIDEAKAKAETLAKDLGVRLVRIVSFSEGGNYPMPMYAVKNIAMDSRAESAPAPELPIGENKIISNVTITYEIR